VEQNLNDICASLQQHLVNMLITRLVQSSEKTGIKEIAIAGGVSANSGLRKALKETGDKLGWNVFIPAFEYCTDNAAMIAMAAHYKFIKGEFCGLDVVPLARMPF
jgi:N6-L-threonylcarbamoyladenine synthase